MQGLNMEMPVAPVMGSNWNNGDDFFKYLILLGFMNNNNGLFGNKGDAAVTSAISNEGNWQNVISKLDGLSAGLSSGLSNLGYQASQGFNGVEGAICSSTFNTSKEISNLASAMAQCCCETQKSIMETNYNMSKGFCDVITAGNLNTRDIIASQNAGNQRIVDLINANTTQELRDKICALENEKTALAFQASQVAQTCNLEKYVNEAIASSTNTIIAHLIKK
ncbi:hypothetical protein [Cetobacterium sp.]|uniref:hypothetical protein n=1 Tax=Cetobacterium sp. TaxID=2071632 RepID=UPI003F3FCA1F